MPQATPTALAAGGAFYQAEIAATEGKPTTATQTPEQWAEGFLTETSDAEGYTQRDVEMLAALKLKAELADRLATACANMLRRWKHPDRADHVRDDRLLLEAMQNIEAALQETEREPRRSQRPACHRDHDGLALPSGS